MKKRRKKKNKFVGKPKSKLEPEVHRNPVVHAMHARHGNGKNTRMGDKRDRRESGKNEERDLKDESNDG